MEIQWSLEKNEKLKRERGLDLEILAEAIQSGDVLNVVKNSRYPAQIVFLILVDQYVCAVPAVPVPDGYFLKTAYRSRRLNKLFNGGD